METTNEPSICIPRVLASVKEVNIRDAFTRILRNEAIERIDIAQSTNPQYKRVFVHLTAWPATEDAALMRNRLKKGEHVNLVYTEGKYWRCVASRLSKPTWQGQAQTPSQPVWQGQALGEQDQGQ